MATIYAVPEHLPVPDLLIEDDWLAKEQAYIESVQEWCRENGEGSLKGEVYRTPVGDGYAVYVVFKNKPLSLIHLPIGDAWAAAPAHERGLRVSDIKAQLAFEKAWSEKGT